MRLGTLAARARHNGGMAADDSASDDYCIVHTSIDTPERARALAHALVEARLAACVQILPIHSVYRWEGRVCGESEQLLLIKTRSACYAALSAFVHEHHPYTTPELVRTPISGGAGAYLQWLDDQTR